MPTTEERLAALEASVAEHQDKLHYIRITHHNDPNYGDIPGWMFAGCRVGVNTDYWMHQNKGQGAALSIGTDFDRFGLYVEMEGTQACPDNPTVAGYFASLAQGPQQNQGLCVIASNSPDVLGVVSTPNIAITPGDSRMALWRIEGIQIIGNLSSFLIGKIGGFIKQIWP